VHEAPPSHVRWLLPQRVLRGYAKGGEIVEAGRQKMRACGSPNATRTYREKLVTHRCVEQQMVCVSEGAAPNAVQAELSRHPSQRRKETRQPPAAVNARRVREKTQEREGVS